jgi:RNA polymerase sigma-70 factor (ECF subfamily)
VWRYLRFLGADPEQADDLTQEAFLALLRAPPGQTGEAAISAWLRRTAYNLFCNSRRRTRAAPLELVEAEAAWQTFVGNGHGDEAMEALAQCLENLPQRMQHALALRYQPEGTRQVVAHRLALTLQGAKTLLRRARERLASCVSWRLAS